MHPGRAAQGKTYVIFKWKNFLRYFKKTTSSFLISYVFSHIVKLSEIKGRVSELIILFWRRLAFDSQDATRWRPAADNGTIGELSCYFYMFVY